MIPLRVLHALTPDPGPAGDGVRALLQWLVRDHHQAGVLVRELATPPAAPGVENLLYRCGPLASLFGSKAEGLRRVAAWIPDIIHVHDLAWLPAAIDIARRLRLSVVVSMTGEEEVVAGQLLRDACIGWVILPTERHRAHYLAKVGLSRDRVTYMPPGVDVTAARAVPYRMVDGALRIGFSGPCHARSGIPLLATALVEFATTAPVRGSYRPSSVADVEELRAMLPPEAMALIDICPVHGEGFMAGIDIFADPGTDDHISIPLIEAMACARPVLALAWGSMPEMVRHGQTAHLVSPTDPGALLCGLRHLIDPARRRELGEAGKLLAAERYDIALVGEAMVELYRMAIGGTRNSSVKAEGSTVYRRISETRLVR